MKKFISIFLLALTYGLSTQAQELEGSTNSIRVKVGKQQVAEPDEEHLKLADLGISRLPRYYALIIGVSKYQNAGPKLPSLEMPERDAERLYQVLTSHYAFKKEDVTFLKSPSREQIINEFDRLSELVGDKDNLLIFYAGHGYYEKSKDFGFWLPSDAKIDSRGTWIPNSTIKDYIRAIRSKHTLLITDACFGGSIFKTRSVSATIQRVSELYRDPSRRAITSGNLSEVPDNSVFLKYLIKALEENKDAFLPTSTLYSRIYEPILNNTPTVPQFGVIQESGDEGGDFLFIRKD